MINKYRLFVLIFIPAALVLAAGMILIQQKNNELSERQFESQLKSQWQLAALLIDKSDYQEELVKLNRLYGLRITLIGQNGEVQIDNAISGQLESHKDREEIKQALAGSPSMVVRFSRTTDSHTIYYAQMLPDGRVLRVAYPASFYDDQKSSLMDQAVSGLIFLVASVALFALIISKKNSSMLASLSVAVKEAQGGGHELPGFNNDDLDKALFALSVANRELRQYSEENLNLRRRLEYILANINEGVLLLEDDRIIYHNQRSEEILGFQIPKNILEIRNQEMMGVFTSFVSGQTEDLHLGDKIIQVSQAGTETNRLIILHDVSDREKYADYKSDLVGNISHELKTPLTLIMGASEVILKDSAMPRAYLDKFLTTIFKNSERINLLLDDLIFLHRLEANREGEPGESDIKEAVADLKGLLGPSDKEIVYKIDPVSVKIHSSHLISVLTNLISNAEKYSRGDHIEVDIHKKGHTLEIRVADQGPSIPVSETNRIFERFYSISKSRNREGSGSGLGLSIVKHITRLYKGQALVESNDFGGNTFVVRLIEK